MAGKQSKNSEDIQTDAQADPEDNDVVPSLPSSYDNESALSLQPNCKNSSDASSELVFVSSQRSLIFAQTARPITATNSDEHLEYIEQMPDNLREENIDILIVNADSDRDEAASFQNHLTKDILFYIHGQARSPRVRLLDEVRHGSMDNLDFAFSKALYVFLYVTKDFCSEPWTLLRGQACLTEAIHDFHKKWCVVPIHTATKKSQKYKLPMMLNSLRPINYWSGNQDQFYIEGVRKLLESKAGLLLERERLLDKARQSYFNENRIKLIQNAEYKSKGLSVCNSNPSHHASASDCSTPTFLPIVVADSSKSSAVHTSSSDGDIYKTNVNRYSSFTNAQDDKALPDVSLAVVRERMEEIAVSENVAVDQNNDLRVNIRHTTTDRSSERPNQEALHQVYDRNGELSQVSGSSHERQSQGTLQQVSDRSHERQSQGTLQQVSGSSHERQSQGTLQQVSDRSYERQSQGTLQQVSDRSHERQSQGTLQQVSDRSHERQSQGTLQQVSDRSHERQSQGTLQRVSDRSHERQSQGTLQQVSDRSHERQSQGTLQQVSGSSHERQSQGTLQQVSDRSYERQSQGTLQQVSDRSHERQSQGTLQQVSDRSHERQSQGTLQQVSDRSHERQSQGTLQRVSDRSHERQSQGTLQQVSDRCHERQGQGTLQQVSDRSHERQSQGTLQQVSDRSHERQSQGTLQQVSDRCHERQSQGTLQQISDRCHERQSQDTLQQASDRCHERKRQGITQQLPDRSCEWQSQGITQQLPDRCHERQSHGITQQVSDRSLERQNQGTPQQISGRNHERHIQGTPQQVSGRNHERQSQGTPQQPHISAVNASTGGIEYCSIRNNTCASRQFNSIEVDGPDGDASSFSAQVNHAPYLYEHRSVPIMTASSYQSNISPAPVSAPQNLPSGLATSDHPAASPMLGHYYNLNTMGSASYMPGCFNQVSPFAFYPYYNPHSHPHLFPFPPQPYPPVQPYTLQELYTFANPMPPPSYFFPSDMRSQSQISMVASSNGSIHTSIEGNTPDSVRSDLSHSLSTSALSDVGSLPGLNSHWSPSENLSCSSVPFHPQPVSSKHFLTSDPRINQPVEGAPAITVQQPQPHIPLPSQQGSFDTSYFGTQAVAAADTHSSSKSDRTFSAGPSSAATSVIQHIHHHHHKKNITVEHATNVLIGDKSKISNRRSVDVISDDESGDDSDAEDDTEAAGGSGPSNSTRFTESNSGSSRNRRVASDVQSGNEESKNVSMGFPEFLSPSSRQPVERSDVEYSVRDDGMEQTCHKELL